MENFDIRKYLIENQLTTNSKQLEENVIKNLVAAALLSLGVIGGVKGQEAPKNTNPITWQQMTQVQKSAVKKALTDKGGFQLFQKYKDSVSTDATNRIEADFAKGAARKGMTVDQYRKYLVKNAKKPDAQPDGLEVGKACKSGEEKGSCVDKRTRGGDSLRDIN